MLKPPEHQVAGHTAAEGQLGPLIDGTGRFYKPLQTNSRGSQELLFYTTFASHPTIPTRIRSYFPQFHGTETVHASDGSGPHPHIVLEDVVSNLSNPSVVDVKIGARTWYRDAPEEYIKKCVKRDRESTSLELGFRISGLRFCDGDGKVVWRKGRSDVRAFGVEDVRVALRKFVACGGGGGLLEQLVELKRWFEEQTVFHFYSASVLLLSGTREEGERVSVVKLVDFAHVVDGGGVIDHNFLGGLCSLIKFVSDVLMEEEDSGAFDGSADNCDR